jgi:hypothetical protein
MSYQITRPGSLKINGWSPDCNNVAALPASSPLAVKKIVKTNYKGGRNLGPPELVDEREWAHPEVGWGLVLPDDANIAADTKARGEDAPEPLRRLLAARPGAPVLRWSIELDQIAIRRYYEDGTGQDLSIAAPTYGIAHGCLPMYLLIYASPEIIPWSVQYALNMAFCVGRLDLGEDEGLGNYIDALIGDWKETRCNPRAPLVWSVDHGRDDITWLMARAISNKLAWSYASDKDLNGQMHLKDGDATCDALVSTLIECKPGLIVTTSHGATGPIKDKVALAAQLGLLVDAKHNVLPLAAMRKWQPSGAIWYAHACCSAGSAGTSRFLTLVDAGSGVGRILAGVSEAAGSRVAPLPRLLLGSSSPLRAFVGHVEPTFDWTLRQPETGEVLTSQLVKSLYLNLYQTAVPMPIGYAFRSLFREAGAYYGAWEKAVREVDHNVPAARDRALYCKLVAMDRQSLVILGDPTVSMARL